MSLMTKTKLDWRPILLEAAFVVLGVVLALAANEYRRAQIDIRNGEMALESIREELRANRTAVTAAARYHLMLADSLGSVSGRAATAGSAPIPEAALFSRGFTAPASLLHTAWDAAAATGTVRHIRYADVLRLSRIYEEQERYRRQTDQIGQLIYTHLFNDGFGGMLRNYANLQTVIGTLWYNECRLLLHFDEVLVELGDAAPEPDAVHGQCERVIRR